VHLGGIIKGSKDVNKVLGDFMGWLVSKSWAEPMFRSAFGERAHYLTEYMHNVSTVRSLGANELVDLKGGLVGLDSIFEILVDLSDFDSKSLSCQKLFDPILTSEPGLWRLGSGAAIWLIPSPKDEILAILLKRRSLGDAQKRLPQFDLLGIAQGSGNSISLLRIRNIDIRLDE
jgi:hypothetical protein